MHIEIERTLREGGRFEAIVPIEPLAWEPGREILAEGVRIDGILTRRRRGIDLDARLTGRLSLECVRCLATFEQPLCVDFHLVLVPAAVEPHSGESQIQPADCDLFACEGGRIDLMTVAREQICLQVPLKPLCREACRGLCARCGEDLNRGACSCKESAGLRLV